MDTEQAKRYVAGDAYPVALKTLTNERVVIVAGPPGVGKTTLADLLLYDHLEKGYQAVLIQRDITEGEQLFQPGVQQIFYFDDFMGATFAGDRVGAASGVNDRALLTFIAMVRATPTARLVLTTREHVYAQALERSERLRQAGLSDLQVVLEIPSYSVIQRARILYNHLYFSDLPDAYRDELLRDEFYMRIVKHEKFNPRLIEWLSSYRRLRAIPLARYRGFIEDLLRDPSEIWRHAYEQEITEAGRSILLAVRSLGGKAGGRVLQAAFAVLHPKRAARYRFPTRPEDFRSGLREVANSFIKPTRYHGFEVVDPSVLDLLNTVIRAAPDNAIDIIEGAENFVQIEQVWTFAKATSSGAVLAALRQQVRRLVPVIGELAIEDRRIDFGGGATGFRGPTYERRLAIIVDMAQRLASHEIADLIGPTMNRLAEAWGAGEIAVNDGVELLRALEGVSSVLATEVDGLRARTQDAIFAEIRTGCHAEELREVLSVIDTSDPASPVVAAARASFLRFDQRHFSGDLRECRSREQFDGFIEDLELFRDKLGVDVTPLIARIEDAKAEFEEQEDASADHMQDEWKEHYRDERDADRSVSDMFASLSGDRD